MVRVTYGSKFDGESWSYATARYELAAINCPDKMYAEIGTIVAEYARAGASKISIKIERL